MGKKRIGLIVISMLVLLVGIGVTIAFLVSSSNQVKNTFTVGDVGITLSETTGSEYKLIPGATVKKNPSVAVLQGSEDCWVFVKVNKKGEVDKYLTYTVADGWHMLAGHSDVYYRQVEEISEKITFKILQDDSVLVRDNVTEEVLNAITEKPVLEFVAYGIQSDGIDSVHDAWQILNE